MAKSNSETFVSPVKLICIYMGPFSYLQYIPSHKLISLLLQEICCSNRIEVNRGGNTEKLQEQLSGHLVRDGFHSQGKHVRYFFHFIDSFSFSSTRCNEAIRMPMAKARGVIAALPPKRSGDAIQSQSMHLHTERSPRELQVEWDEYSWECCSFTSCIFQACRGFLHF